LKRYEGPVIGITPSGRPVGQVNVLHKGGREEKREVNDYGHESNEIKLRDDKALVPYAA
jgi:hypothetical protein